MPEDSSAPLDPPRERGGRVAAEHAAVLAEEVTEARPAEPLIRHLEEELDQLKIHQRATVEEYEASLEERKSSNEELQAINADGPL